MLSKLSAPSARPQRGRSPRIAPLLALLLLGIAQLQALDLSPDKSGIHIDAGSLGSFELSYPVFYDGSQRQVHKLIEARPSGKTAQLKYEDGALVNVAIEPATGVVTLHFQKTPADIKAYRMSMLIDLAFSQGGHWKIDGKTEPFPRSKPPKPQVFQGHAPDVEILNSRNQSLKIVAPEYAFQELQDNREWNWGIFEWRFTAPFEASRSTAKLTITADLAKDAKPAVLVDQFGQSTAEDWPGKVKSLDELKGDVARDDAYYASLHPPATDLYGGQPDSGKRLGLTAQPFFHVEQKSGKWWLVDPAGNAFFHLGLCGFSPGDDYTYIEGRESIYQWLPKFDSEFKTAFRAESGPSVFSFHLANTIRKYGQPFQRDTYATRMIQRVRKWGFNSMGAFSDVPADAVNAAHFPYVAHLPLDEWQRIPRIPGAHETLDPFDEATRKRVEENIAKDVPKRADDPLLIGWFIVNEPRYDELPKALPALTGQHACKKQLVASLQKKYGTINAFNQAWNAKAVSFDELVSKGLAVQTPAATKDVQDFVGKFLDAYFSLINTAYRKYDSHHLLLGSRLQPVTIENEQLCRIMGKYVDVMSYNYYTYGIDKAALKRYYDWTGGKPMMLSEFFWSSPKDSGLVGGREVNSQQERGLAYRNYVEQSASLGFVIGIEWFTLVDQATTGRWFSKYTGESCNTGLFSVADRPWKPMVEEMAKANADVYDVVEGKRAPFAWDDARVKGK